MENFIFICVGFVISFLLFCGVGLLVIFPFLFTHESAMRECQLLRRVTGSNMYHIKKKWYGWVVIEK